MKKKKMKTKNKKLFPSITIPRRPSSSYSYSRKKSGVYKSRDKVDGVGSGVRDDLNNTNKNNLDISERSIDSTSSRKSSTSRSSIVRSFVGGGRGSNKSSSFRFGFSSSSVGECTDGDLHDTTTATTTTTNDLTPLSYSKREEGSRRPPLMPRRQVSAPIQQQQQQQSTTTLLTKKRTRSLTPSDIHYLNSTNPSLSSHCSATATNTKEQPGGCNASLTPISHHYQTNETLLNLFTTLLYDDESSHHDDDATTNNGDQQQQQRRVVAYAAGIKFVEVALFTIPQHGYYNSEEQMKLKSIMDAVKVTKLLDELVTTNGGCDDMVEGSEEKEKEDDSTIKSKKEQVDRLSNVAKQRLQQVVDSSHHDGKVVVEDEKEKKTNNNVATNNASSSSSSPQTFQISRLWNEYILGEGEEEGDGTSKFTCGLPMPIDYDICSFWNNMCGGGGACSQQQQQQMDCVDDVMSNTREQQSVLQQRYQANRLQEKQQLRTKDKKRAKIDHNDGGLLLPEEEPINLPQVFIKKNESNVVLKEQQEEQVDEVDGDVNMTSSNHDERTYQSDDDMSSLIVDTKMSGVSQSNNIGIDHSTHDGKDVVPMDVNDDCQDVDQDYLKPKTHPGGKKSVSDMAQAPTFSLAATAQSSQDSNGRNSSTLSIVTEEASSKQDTNRTIEQQPTIVISSNEFDKNTLHQLALSMQENDIHIVSSSSESSTIAVEAPPEHDTNDTSSVAVLASLYHEQYTILRDKNIFHVRFLDTFQGRNPMSTNGCTVIAPLTCIHYFTSTEQNRVVSSSSSGMHGNNAVFFNDGIPDDLINQVIDDHASSILPTIRNKLNLGQDSFIIPSDVHDHLIEIGLLDCSQFVGVCGGNILDEQHLSAFKRSLLLLDDKRERERLKGRKIGATLFFHGHVVAIHVIVNENGDDDENVWVELIDSLPNPETWIAAKQNPPERKSSSSVDMMEDTMCCFTNSSDWEQQSIQYDSEELPQNAVRVRCTNIEHFDTLILQYALSKFSEEEQRFVDSTMWEDNSAYCEHSFDPRVFQAFIWAEAE